MMVTMVVIVTGTPRILRARHADHRHAGRDSASASGIDHRLTFDLEFGDLEIHFPQGFDRMLQAYLAEKRNLERAFHLMIAKHTVCCLATGASEVSLNLKPTGSK